MTADPSSASASARALRHVASLSSGQPLDRALPLTLNFHPDRMAGGRPVLAKPAEDGVYHPAACCRGRAAAEPGPARG
ncbi:hypothetical protein ACWD6R_19400 [Streptomyces sp. NPDC005151]